MGALPTGPVVLMWCGSINNWLCNARLCVINFILQS